MCWSVSREIFCAIPTIEYKEARQIALTGFFAGRA